MIDYESLTEALGDLTGHDYNEPFDPEEIERRLEFLGIDFKDFRTFILERVHGLAVEDGEPDSAEWATAYVRGAVDFFALGVLCGRADSSEYDFLKDLE